MVTNHSNPKGTKFLGSIVGQGPSDSKLKFSQLHADRHLPVLLSFI